MSEVSRFMVFPVDPDSDENLSLTDLFPTSQPNTGTGHTHTKNLVATHTAAGSLYELVAAPRLPECHCGCGRRIVGKQKYATTACQVRAWRARHPGRRPSSAVEPKVSICKKCLGWQMGDGRSFICDDCANGGWTADTPFRFCGPLLRLSPHNDQTRSAMIYFGPVNIYSRMIGNGEVTEIIGYGDIPEAKPLVQALIERLGGRGNLVPTAMLAAEAQKQQAARRALTGEA